MSRGFESSPVGCSSYFVFCMRWRPPRSTLFPYTTLFRSPGDSHCPVDELLASPKRAREFVQTITARRSEEHTSELQSLAYLVCRLLLEKKNGTCRKPSCRCSWGGEPATAGAPCGPSASRC